MPAEPGPGRFFASIIDHTVLSPAATVRDIERLCREAEEHCFAGVCVNPCHISLAASLLRGKSPAVITVIGFPLGSTTTYTKAVEAAQAVELGADELDMVLNVGALKDGNTAFVKRDISEVVRAAEGKPVKVILETCLLTDEQKRLACALCAEAGAAYVKTSTGFGKGGATEHDIRLMREVVGQGMGVKASGGIRTLDDARRMVEAGASRLGTSSSIAIVTAAGKAAAAPDAPVRPGTPVRSDAFGTPNAPSKSDVPSKSEAPSKPDAQPTPGASSTSGVPDGPGTAAGGGA